MSPLKTINHRLIVFCSLLLVVFRINSAGADGRMIRLTSYGSDPSFKRNVDIWLPPGYPAAGPYNVLYMHDGQMLFDSTATWNHQEWTADETAGRLIQEGLVLPAIIVGIWNGGESRHADYFPQKCFESLEDTVKIELYGAKRPEGNSIFNDYKVRSDNYLEFIVHDLKPHIDSNYNTFKDKKHTFIGGSSMGGLISWYAACEYPDVFGGAICMSTHWPGIFRTEDNPVPEAFFEYLDKKLPESGSTKFYFDRGTAGLDAYYEASQSIVDSLFISKGYDDLHYMSKVFMGDDHNEKAWSNRLSVPLIFMLGREH